MDAETLVRVVDVGTNVVGAASMLAAIFPKATRANKAVGILSALVNLLAFNVGNAKNKE